MYTLTEVQIRIFEIFILISFLVLLVAAIFMFISFYVCDSHTCKAFNLAANKGPTGSKDYTLALLGELYNDGIWPMAYIGSTVSTLLFLWFTGVPITVKSFTLMFIVGFIIIYFLFSFFGHHYIRCIASYTADYIQNNCPGTNVQDTLSSDYIPGTNVQDTLSSDYIPGTNVQDILSSDIDPTNITQICNQDINSDNNIIV